MRAAKAQAVINPLSSFYPTLAGGPVAHAEPDLDPHAYYDTSADPNLINIYFFNGTEYLIEQNHANVDTNQPHDLRRGQHFSTFVVLQNNQPVVQVTGTPHVADIEVFNFPNLQLAD